MDISERFHYDCLYSAFKEESHITSRQLNELIDEKVIESHREVMTDKCINVYKDVTISEDFKEKLTQAYKKRDRILSLAQEYERIATNEGIFSVTVEDNDYPSMWRKLQGMPRVIYCKGRREILGNLESNGSASIVGSRFPGSYALYATRDFAEKLSQKNIVIVSGLAIGIDRVAHETSLANKGSTIAVLAGGPDNIYPYKNKDVYSILSKEGLIISEMPPGQKAMKQYFPSRNRLISALGDVCLIMEAGVHSGTLHTASFAATQGKEVYVLPNSIYYDNNIGGHQLIADGANILIDSESVIDSVIRELLYRKTDCKLNEELIRNQRDELSCLREKQELYPELLENDEIKKLICEELSVKSRNEDELVGLIHISFSRLSQALTELEFEKKIHLTHGKYTLTFF